MLDVLRGLAGEDAGKDYYDWVELVGRRTEKLDGIAPLEDPPRVPASEAGFLPDRERVFGVSAGGAHRAYPLRFLSWHERSFRAASSARCAAWRARSTPRTAAPSRCSGTSTRTPTATATG